MITAETLQELISQNSVIPIKFNQQNFLLDALGVLYWPKYDMLVFSDLHLEKGSYLQQFANPIPRFDSHDTINRIQTLVKRYDCKQVLCLGDSFHDSHAIARMDKHEISRLNVLVENVDNWLWVLGNHDPEIPCEVLGQRHQRLVLDSLLFVHEPELLKLDGGIRAQIVGHFHPKTSHKLGHTKVHGKTFVLEENILLMPAFGSYTGGLDISDSAFDCLLSRNHTQRYLMFQGAIYKL